MINENTIHEESSSSFPKGLEEFRRNIKNKDNSSDIYCHNLYLLQTTDRDGNVTGEAYGMNLMTNWGFKNIYTSTTSYTNCKIYIGNGTDEPVLTNNALYSPIITTGSTNVNTSASIYPFQYDSSTGIITGIQRIYQGYFDYNISGITENFDITEIGYGTSTTQLVSHARIYDSEGNPSSITKRINERLTINVFWTLNMKESIIQSNYENGVYIVMRPAFSGLLTKTYSRTLYTIYGSQKIGCTESYSNNMYYNVATLLDDNNVKSTIKPNSLLIENQRSYISDIVAVDQRRSSTSTYVENITGEFYFMIMTKDKLPTPEEITTYEAYTDEPSSNSFSNLFGLSYDSSTCKGELPCTNFNITSLSMYNHLTKEWDIEEEFVSDANSEYDNVWRSFVRIYTDFGNLERAVWVYVNTRTDLPITSFNNSNIVLYATDKYWDTSTWELISNIGNVDESLQCKRYYIRTTKTNESTKYILYPQRNMVHQKIIPDTSLYVDNTISAKQVLKDNNYLNLNQYYDIKWMLLCSDEYGWFLIDKTLVYPNLSDGSYVSYTLPSKCDITTGDMLISMGSTSIRVYDVSDPTKEPTYQDIPLIFENLGSYYYYLTDTGFIMCIRSDGVDECLIINLHDKSDKEETISQYILTNAKMGRVVETTSMCVYQKTDTSTITFVVYDMLNKSDILEFNLPPYDYTIIGIIAWNSAVYINATLNDTNISFMYDINNNKLTQLLFNVPNVYPDDCVKECLIISSTSENKTYIFKETDPSQPIIISSLSFHKFQLKYTNDSKQLIALVMCSSSYYNFDITYVLKCIDIGRIIDNGSSYNIPMGDKNIAITATEYHSGMWAQHYYTTSLFACMIQNCVVYMSYSDDSRVPSSYDNNYLTWVDIKNCLPHKMTGTTTTIQAWNNPKRLQNKEYSFTLTNDTTNWGDDTNV